MGGKKVFLLGLAVLLFTGWSLEGANAQTSGSGQALQVDPERSALMLRKGQESFSRSKFNEAKDFFRKAVQTDPTSPKAWSYYDLSLFYTVGEQYKNHGKVVLSTAPQTEVVRESAPSGAPTVPATEPALKELKGKTVPPGIKEKPYPAPEVKKPGAKDKPYPAPEIKKPAEPKTPAVTAPVPPTPPAKIAPAAPTPAPTPAPAPGGGFKILKDEGC
jgi:hypothetical protein